MNLFRSLKGMLILAILIPLFTSCGNEKKTEAVLYPETTANPPGGNYPKSNYPIITLECNKPATIYYTLNGELPEPGRSYTYSGRSPVAGIEIKQDTTLRFFAIDDDGNQEAVKTEVYTIDQPPLTSAAPKGGLYKSPVRVTLTSSEDARIYYTLDGSLPTRGSFVYSSPILISKEGGTVLKFFAVDLAGNAEDVRVEQYIIDTQPPVTRAFPSGGRYGDKNSVTLSASEPATIYYRYCDGVFDPGKCPDPDPSQQDVLFGDTTVSGIEVGTGVLKYFSIDRAGNREDIGVQVYLMGNQPYTTTYPSGGIYNSPLLVWLTSDVISGATATIYYTTDGTQPDTSSPSCMSPCSVFIYSEGRTELRFYALDSFGNTEDIRTEVYTVDSIPPTTVASPGAGEYIGAQTVTLTSSEPATIYYTLDGSTPDPDSPTTLSGESPVSDIVIPKDRVLKFYSVDRAGNKETPVKSSSYSILYRVVEDFVDDRMKDSSSTDAQWDIEKGVLLLNRQPLSPLNTISTGGTSYRLKSYGNYLYLIDGSRGLKIYDITFPTDPELKGNYPPSPGEVFYSMEIRNHTGFIGTSAGVVILDLSDPTKPGLLSRWNLSAGDAIDIKLYEDYLFVASGSEGLWILDVSDPFSPLGVKRIPLTDTARRIAVNHINLYVADTQGDLKIFDIKNPASPQFIRTVGIPGSVYELSIYEPFLFLGSDSPAIYIFDLSDPEKPLYFTSISLQALPQGINFRGNRLFVGTQQGLEVFDIKDPATPEKIVDLQTGAITDIKFYGNYLYTAGDNIGVFPGSNFVNLNTKSQLTGFYAGRARVDGIRASIPAGTDGVRFLKLFDPISPVLYPYTTGGSVSAVALSDNFGVLAQGAGGMAILDISDLSSPTLLSSLPSSDARDVDLIDGYALLADGASGLKVIEIKDLRFPTVAGVCAPGSCLPVGSSCNLVRAQGSLAFAGLDTNQISVIDISQKDTPVQISSITTSGISVDMALWGSYLYVAEGASGIEVFYVKNPNFPQKTGSITTISATGITLYGNNLIIADGNSIHFADLTLPGSPYIYRTYTEGASALSVFGDYLLITDGAQGAKVSEFALESFHYSSSSEARSLNLNPTPDRVVSARITTLQGTGSNTNVQFYLTNDGGNNWISVNPGGSMVNFVGAGSDLRWRAILSTTDPRSTPEVDRIEVYYKYE